MVFSSILFLFCFLPVFLISYHLVSKKYKNYILLTFSLIFYAWGAPKFIFILLLSLIANYYIVNVLYLKQKHRKVLLLSSLFINVGLLAYFKYANFFIENTNIFLEGIGLTKITWLEVALPIGISFFTFQSITYTVDVYRRTHKPLNQLTDYLLYILMFPQLIAGPIVRFNTVADDIIDRQKNETLDNKLYGLCRFAIGLSKKVILANVLGEQVDSWFALPYSELDSGIAWIAIIAYSFQIYFDFSGYSDMAIGLGRIIGFKFPENFNNPYISQNISEFWRRWHITLGEWMKDYLYIPLGGNRVKTKRRVYFNLIVVFLISGLWHGAAWNFVIWGAWHGIFLILDRVFLIKMFKRVGRIPKVLFNYIIVLIGWVFFRIENFNNAILFLKKMFAFDFSNSIGQVYSEFTLVLFISVIIAFSTLTRVGRYVENRIYSEKRTVRGNVVMVLFVVILFLLSASYITSSGFNPFIYFRF